MPRAPSSLCTEDAKYNSAAGQSEWIRLLTRGLHPTCASVDEFLNEHLPPHDMNEAEMLEKMKDYAATALKTASAAARVADRENQMYPSFTAYLNAVVSALEGEQKPSFHDTHLSRFRSPIKGEHGTAPDITGTRPNKTPQAKQAKPCSWTNAGVIVEFKVSVHLFSMKNGRIEINPTADTRNDLIQLAKNARNLFISSQSCHVFVLSVVKEKAHILRWDRSGFRTTEMFDWTQDDLVLPKFLYRFYRPKPSLYADPGPMNGDDDTISIPTREERAKMCQVLKRLDESRDWHELTRSSRWMKAVIRDDPSPRMVRCFTFDAPLALADRPFGRATRVFQVILEDALQSSGPPPVYALKDTWRQVARRPEIDYYDVYEKWCTLNGVTINRAKCLGSVDLADPDDGRGLPRNFELHRTCSSQLSPRGLPTAASPTTALVGGVATSLSSHDLTVAPPAPDALKRHHMRTLHTPVCRPVAEFPSTLTLVSALYDVLKQLHHLHQAGIVHRDVSENNIALYADGHAFYGILFDFDYAEFTPAGLANFKKWFPKEHGATCERYTAIRKSLKDFTGTLPFIALEILIADTELLTSGVTPGIIHAFKHDVESLLWVLLWMIVRHTAHSHSSGPMACYEIFDNKGTGRQLWLMKGRSIAPSDNKSLHNLLEQFRLLCVAQTLDELTLNALIKAKGYTVEKTGEKENQDLTFEKVQQCFDDALRDKDPWPQADAATPFVVPSLVEEAVRIATESSHKRQKLSEEVYKPRGAYGDAVDGDTIALDSAGDALDSADNVLNAGLKRKRPNPLKPEGDAY